MRRALLLIAALSVSCSGRGKEENVVVVYVSEDRVFSEPILKDFERETGIKVKAIYDTEESKSTGLMNRLIAEKGHPRADVYWANEPIRAEVLRQKGLLQPYISPNAKGIPEQFRDPRGYWTGFSARARVLLVNSRVKNKPHSILDYVNPEWKGRAVIANPLFGTTTVHMAVLFVLWGDEKAKEFLNKMKENRVKISSSNGESADLVASGQFDFALVDNDDAVSRIRRGEPVEMVFPDQGEGEMGVLLLPNAVMLIKGAPHPENGRKLVDYLLSRETERKLAFADCAQIPLHSGVDMPPELEDISRLKTIEVDYGKVARKLEEIQPLLKKWVGY